MPTLHKLCKMHPACHQRLSTPVTSCLDKSLLSSSTQIVSPARDGISDVAAPTDPPSAAELVSADLESSLLVIVSAHILPARLLATKTQESVGPPLKPGGDSQTRLSAASTINDGAKSSQTLHWRRRSTYSSTRGRLTIFWTISMSSISS